MKVACATGAMSATVFVDSLLRLTIVLYGHTYKHIPTKWEFSLSSFSHLFLISLSLRTLMQFGATHTWLKMARWRYIPDVNALLRVTISSRTIVSSSTHTPSQPESYSPSPPPSSPPSLAPPPLLFPLPLPVRPGPNSATRSSMSLRYLSQKKETVRDSQRQSESVRDRRNREGQRHKRWEK